MFGFAAAILKCDCGKQKVGKVAVRLSLPLSLSFAVFLCVYVCVFAQSVYNAANVGVSPKCICIAFSFRRIAGAFAFFERSLSKIEIEIEGGNAGAPISTANADDTVRLIGGTWRTIFAAKTV